MTTFAVVIPTCAGREENLTAVLECVAGQTVKPKLVVIVCDGEDSWMSPGAQFSLPTIVVRAPKHHPGMEQPRNLGLRTARKVVEEKPEFSFTHVAFLDSDILVAETLLECYARAIEEGGPDGLYYGPYEWMNPGMREIDHSFFNDPRWEMFRAHKAGDRYENDLSKGLGAFSGNLVWNADDFEATGGFWNEIHHGRCEDGELGLRAVAQGMRVGLVPEARGFHLDHPRNMNWMLEANARDVPMLNERHPWVQGRCSCRHLEAAHENGPCDVAGCDCTEFSKALFIVEKDGKRFDTSCSCGWKGHAILMWQHQSECPANTIDYARSAEALSL